MTDTFDDHWRTLHGFALSDAARPWASGSATELANFRPDDFLQSKNVFEAAMLSAVGSHALNLWEPLLSVLPVRALGNGDILYLFVPAPTQPDAMPAIVVWNHERDYFEKVSDQDLEEAELPTTQSLGDANAALSFASRGAYLIELLARGRFDLNRYLSFNRPAVNVEHPQLLTNVRAWPATATYALWHLYFSGDDASLAKVLVAAEESGARWTRDCAALIRELLAGRDEVGALRGVAALRAEVARVISDPEMTAKAAAAQRRADIDARLFAQVGPVKLVRDDAPATPDPGTRQADFGALTLEAREVRTGQFRLVLRDGARSIGAMPLTGTGGAPEREPHFVIVQIDPVPVVALWHRSDPAVSRHPHDGSLELLAIAGRRLCPVAAFEFDLERVERRDGVTLARTRDGAAYRVPVIEPVMVPAPPALPPLPGQPATCPAACPAPEIEGDRLELTPTSLQLWRGKKLLFEEPRTENYAMTVLPKRRMVAIHGANFELRPTIDVYWIRPLQKKVKAGEGCCSWVCFPADGLDVQLKSTEDRLYVYDGHTWLEIDAEPLTTVPSWIQSRGWL